MRNFYAQKILDPEGGGGFNPRITPAKSKWALAPEECFPGFSPGALLFFVARLVCILTLLSACLPALPQAALSRITGTVVNSASGEPVQRVTVSALSTSDHRTIASVESGNDGRFALEGLAAAKYELAAYKRGFLLSLYDEHELYNSAIVTGEGQQTEGLIFRIMPSASLHGVVSADSGDPVEDAKVLLFLKPRGHNPGARITQKAETTTDDTGAYDFGDLAPGEYFLAVTAQPWYALHHPAAGPHQRPGSDPSAALDVAYPVTFFDTTTDEASATPIILAGGSREEANINLHAVPALRLTVETPTKVDGRVAQVNLRQTIFGKEISEDLLRVNNTVEFTGVAPGHYELTQGDPPHIADLDVSASQQIDPNLGKPAVEISGTLRTTSGAALPDRVTMSVLSLDAVHRQVPIYSVSNNGQFAFEPIRQGAWELAAESAEKQLPITSITVGNRPHPGNRLTVQDKPLQMVVTVSLGETRIEGFVRMTGVPGDRFIVAGVEKDEKGATGVMVVLVPKDLAAFPALARRDQSDSDGSFALRDAAPGQYTVVAVENGWDLDWERPEVISRYLPGGVPVTVTESSGKLVRLTQAVPVQSQ